MAQEMARLNAIDQASSTAEKYAQEINEFIDSSAFIDDEAAKVLRKQINL